MATLKLNSVTALTEDSGQVAVNLGGGSTAPSSPSNGDMYYDQSKGLLKVWNGTRWKVVQILKELPGSGSGVGHEIKHVYTGGADYVMHIFHTSGFFTLNATTTCDVLLVGGGGSGGPSYGNADTGKGGGGAGGVQFRAGYSLPAGDYEIGIGRGGQTPLNDRGYEGESNFRYYTATGGSTTWHAVSDSSYYSDSSTNPNSGIIANGGGGGGGVDNHFGPKKGGSGGGAGARSTSYTSGAASELRTYTGWTKYGNAGGNSDGSGNYGGAGGGGAGGAGGNHGTSGNESTSSGNADGGYGGIGVDMTSYFGTEVGDRGFFAGGGGGGSYYGSAFASTSKVALGGKGGGGNGVWTREQGSFDYNNPTLDNKSFKIDGMDGTGGGGGGSGEGRSDVSMHGAHNGNGGSGIAIVRYAL